MHPPRQSRDMRLGEPWEARMSYANQSFRSKIHGAGLDSLFRDRAKIGSVDDGLWSMATLSNAGQCLSFPYSSKE